MKTNSVVAVSGTHPKVEEGPTSLVGGRTSLGADCHDVGILKGCILRYETALARTSYRVGAS